MRDQTKQSDKCLKNYPQSNYVWSEGRGGVVRAKNKVHDNDENGFMNMVSASTKRIGYLIDFGEG